MENYKRLELALHLKKKKREIQINRYTGEDATHQSRKCKLKAQ